MGLIKQKTYGGKRNAVVMMVLGWTLALQYIILRSAGIIQPSKVWVWSDLLGGISVIGAIIGIIGLVIYIRADKMSDD